MVGASAHRGLRTSLTALFLLTATLWAANAAAQTDSQPPTVSAHSPAPGASGVSTAISLTATFAEPVQPASISFVLRTSTGTVVPSASTTYDASSRTASLDPIDDLVGSQTYTATVSGARDFSGNAQVAPIVWSFTTATPGFQDPVVFSGLVNPTVVQFAPDGRVFVAEKSGVIQVFDSLSDTTPAVFADLRTKVHDFGERGLLGMVLDPAFPTRPYVYVLYTHDAAIGGTAPRWGIPNSSPDPCPDPIGTGCTVSARLSRLVASGNQMTGAEQVLVEDWFQQFPGQSIGSLAFGPDGALYASAGDGASSTFVDSGQATNPSVDPPNEGGALRSQDVRTPADPVTLDGAIVRVDPNTGLPLPRVPAMAIGPPTTDGSGVRSYPVTSVFQGPVPTIVRVLEPSAPAPGQPHRLLYVLPVEAGVTSTSSQYSDGLEELRLLDVHNRFNATLIAPSFHIEPWYGDHATDPERWLESFIVNDLVPFGDTFALAGGTPQRWLIGFSKSATGALSLILRHPHVFSLAAAWDGPAQFTDMSAFPGMAENFGTEENFDRFEIPTLVARNAGAFKQHNRIWISGDQSVWTPHMVALDQQMDQAAVLHTFAENGPRAHGWFSGWLDGAVTSLAASAPLTAPIDPNAQRMVAYGLRRPARFTFRPGTSEIWLGDIGSNAFEEVNRIVNAADGTLENFGWPCYEGTATTPFSAAGLSICNELVAQPGAAVAPFHSYAHGQPLFTGDTCNANSSSISGLAFAGSGSYPASYDGALFLADRRRNCIWVMFKGANGLPNPGNSAAAIVGAASPVDLKVGPAGDLFYADHDGGTIRRLRRFTGNLPPVAVIQAGPAISGPAPLVVDFSAAGSSDPEGAPLSYVWDLDGDGAFDDSTLAQPSFTYTGAGSRTVQVLVSDGQGLSAAAAVVVSTNNTPALVSIGTPTASLIWSVGDVISFSGSATDPEDGVLPASALVWSLIAHHCPSSCHSHALQDFAGVAGGSFVAPDHEYPSHLELRLTATDALGLQSTTSVLLQPRTIVLTFASSPVGLQLSVGSSSSTTPFTRTVIVGSSNAISAPSPQGGSQFVSWSDGGIQTHTITAGAAPATYTATFTLPVPPNLVLGLSLDEGTGTVVADRSGNSNNGTISGATWTTQGKFGNALSFDGVNDWVTVADANTLDLTSALTLEAWVFPTANGGGSWRNVAIKERTGGEIYNLYANADTNAPAMFAVRASQPSAPLDARGTSQLPLTTWTHLASTYDGVTLRLYVNGVQVGSRAGSGSILTSTGALRVGGNSVWGEFFQGRLDEIRVYNRALTQAEIQADMNTPVGTPPSDTTPPVRSNGAPIGTLPAGTTQTALSLLTNENATCRLATSVGVPYGSMPTAFTTTGATAHFSSVTGLADGGSYSYFVRCQDPAGNANPDDFAIAFAVASPPADTTPPVRSSGAPTGTLPAGTTQTVLSLLTNENATCRHATSAGVPYGSMPTVFGTTGATVHSALVTGLTNGGSYSYFVRCQDSAGNPNVTDFAISFSVAPGADLVPPLVTITAPSDGATIAGIVTVTASASDNIGVVAVQFLLDGVNLGAEDTTSPYSMSFDTTTAPVGPHTLSARARDAAGNVATAATVNVAVTNNPVPAGFSDEVVIGSGLTFPTAFEFLPDGRMLIAEFGGRVLVAQAGATAVDPTAVLQLTNVFGEDVTLGGERGLVNIVADPDFGSNGFIYLFYTAATPQRDRVSRFTMTGSTASLASELVVWQAIANSTSTDHHGGGLAFGPDGKLYVSTGDNGDPASSQPLIGDHGKILRVNKDGTVPTDNPFYDGGGANVDAIWARGLRNPYRFSFDPANGRMFIGDVGQNSVEELNVGVSGANYGWPTCEGSCGTAGMTNPVFTYPHGGRDAAITGGFVYRNPSGLVASYSFDEGSGSTTQDASGNNLTGTISGATWTSAGKFGSALSFDGVNDLVTVADANALDLTTSMTLEAWVFPTALGASWRNVIIKERPGGEVYNLYANTDTNVPAVYVVRAAAPGTPLDARGTAQLALNTWTHLAATYDGATLRIFANGALVGSRAVTGSLIASTGALRLGGNALWGEYFAGRIDEVRIYNRALAQAEIQADMLGAPAVNAGQFPAPYDGAYFYGDFAQNWIRYLTLDGSGSVTGGASFLPADGSLDGPYDPVMLKPGPGGSLYYVDFGWGSQGTVNPAAIRRIRYTLGNQPPVAVVSATPANGAAPLSVNFSSAGSNDPEGQALSYSWSFGDGAISTQAHPTHVYAQPGVYNARLSLSDGTNTTLSNFLLITVGAPPVATITSPSNGLTFRAGDLISFAGTATDAEDGTLAAAAFSWMVVFHHDSHVHPALGPLSGSTTGTFAIPTSGHDFTGNTNYEITLTVTDSNGLQSTKSVFVFPQKVNLSFSTSPAGLSVTIDGISQTTPHVKESLIGFQHTIGAPNQVLGSLSYTFSSWSDFGSQSHSIVVPSTALSYVATFQSTGPPPPPPGLVAGYAFNQGSGTTAQDASGNNRTGTISGATWTTAGKFGNALSFDGVNDWVTVADANALDLTTGMTLEAWVFPTALGTSWRNVIIKERPGGEVYNLYANVDTSVPVVYVARASAPAAPLDARGTAQLPLNAWSHLAATYDGTTLRIYVNGSQVGTRAVTGALVASTGVLRMGGNSLWGEYFAGRIDEVRIYNRALTSVEIQTDLNTPLP